MHRKTSSRKCFHLIDARGDTKVAAMDQHSIRRVVGTGAFRGSSWCIRKKCWTLGSQHLSELHKEFISLHASREWTHRAVCRVSKPPSWIDERSGMSGIFIFRWCILATRVFTLPWGAVLSKPYPDVPWTLTPSVVSQSQCAQCLTYILQSFMPTSLKSRHACIFTIPWPCSIPFILVDGKAIKNESTAKPKPKSTPKSRKGKGAKPAHPFLSASVENSFYFTQTAPDHYAAVDYLKPFDPKLSDKQRLHKQWTKFLKVLLDSPEQLYSDQGKWLQTSWKSPENGLGTLWQERDDAETASDIEDTACNNIRKHSLRSAERNVLGVILNLDDQREQSLFTIKKNATISL